MWRRWSPVRGYARRDGTRVRSHSKRTRVSKKRSAFAWTPGPVRAIWACVGLVVGALGWILASPPTVVAGAAVVVAAIAGPVAARIRTLNTRIQYEREASFRHRMRPRRHLRRVAEQPWWQRAANRLSIAWVCADFSESERKQYLALRRRYTKLKYSDADELERAQVTGALLLQAFKGVARTNAGFATAALRSTHPITLALTAADGAAGLGVLRPSRRRRRLSLLEQRQMVAFRDRAITDTASSEIFGEPSALAFLTENEIKAEPFLDLIDPILNGLLGTWDCR